MENKINTKFMELLKKLKENPNLKTAPQTLSKEQQEKVFARFREILQKAREKQVAAQAKVEE